MGVFDFLLKGLGFEDKNESKNEKVKVNREVVNQSSFVPINAQQPVQKSINVNNLVVYAPKNNADVKLLVNCLKHGEACIVNFGGLEKAEVTRILDFLSGAVCALDGKISKLQNQLYVVSPNNVVLTTI